MIELTTSVKKNKTDVVFNNIIILRSCTTSVLSQKRRGEEKTHVGWIGATLYNNIIKHHVGYGKKRRGESFTTSFLTLTDVVCVFVLKKQIKLATTQPANSSTTRFNSFSVHII